MFIIMRKKHFEKYQSDLRRLENCLEILSRRYETTEANIVSNGIKCVPRDVPVLRVRHPGDDYQRIGDPEIGLIEAVNLLAAAVGIRFRKVDAQPERAIYQRIPGEEREPEL